MNERKCDDLKCVQKPTRGRLSLQILHFLTSVKITGEVEKYRLSDRTIEILKAKLVVSL